MSGAFQEGVLSDIARVTMGQSPRKEFVSPTEQGLPLLNGPTEFGNFHPTPVQWATSYSKTAEEGDILFCVRGSTTGRMNWADQRYAIGRGIASISAINSRERYFVRGAIDLSLPELLSSATGSTFPNVSGLQLTELPVALPSEAVRSEISGLLGALDDKIESNDHLITGIPTLIRALVEKELEASALPVPLSGLGRFVNGGAYTKGATGTGRMVIRIADLNSGPGESTVYNEIDVPDDKTARPGDILMSWSGSLGVYVWHRPEAIINQHIFKVVPNAEIPRWLVFDRLEAAITELQAIAADKATTMGHIQRRHLETTTVELPAERIHALDEICAPLWDRRNQLLRESLRLAELRDTLLPGLMSGRIRVPEVREAMNEEVGDVEIR